MTKHLTPAEAARFHRDGILIPRRPLLPDQDFQALRAAFEALLPEWTGRYRKRPEEMDKPHFLWPELLRWAAHPQVLDLVEDLIGPDIALFTTHFICKPPGDGRRVPWHEDSGYWTGMITPMEDVLTVWLAIDPSLSENGCVRYVPGSHRTPDGTYVPVRDPSGAVFATELADELAARAEREAVEAVLEPNRCSVHHAKTIHGSRPNHSALRRCGLTLRFFSTRCRWLHQERTDPHFDVYLVRGRDHAGNRYGRLGEVNAAWRDRLLAEAAA
jgi:hypothetical protein